MGVLGPKYGGMLRTGTTPGKIHRADYIGWWLLVECCFFS